MCQSVTNVRTDVNANKAVIRIRNHTDLIERCSKVPDCKNELENTKGNERRMTWPF